MRFFLNGVQVNVQIGFSLTEVLDENKDSGVVTLQANNVETEYAPMQTFTIDFEDSQTPNKVMYILGDSVSIYSTNPKTFLHRLTLTQNIASLDKLALKNSVFSQPSDVDFRCLFSSTNFNSNPSQAGSFVYFASGSINYEANFWCDSFQLDTRTIYSLFKLKCKFYQLVAEYDFDTKTIAPTPLGGFIECNNLNFVNSNGYLSFDVLLDGVLVGTINQAITASQYYFGCEIDCPQLDSIIQTLKTQNKTGTITLCVHDYLTNGTKFTDVTYFADSASSTGYYCNIFVTMQIEINAKRNYFSVYDVLQLIVNRYQQTATIGSGTSATTLNKRLTPFSLPTSGDLYNLLTNTIAPNFVFTQCTIYEAVAEIFKLYNAIFTLDENNVLGIEYFVENIQTSVTPTGLVRSITSEKYNNRLLTNYQNAKQLMSFPNYGGFAPLRSNALGVPEKNDHIFKVPFTIDTIKEVFVNCGFYISNMPSSAYSSFQSSNTQLNLEISNFVVEYSLWTTLNEDKDIPINGNYQTIGKNNTIYYTKGTDYIQVCGYYSDYLNFEIQTFGNVLNGALNRFFGRMNIPTTGSVIAISYTGIVSNDWSTINMSANYYALIDGRIEIESLYKKYDGEYMVNQANGSIDLTNLLSNVFGLSHRIGNATLVYTAPIQSSYSACIHKGDYIIQDNEKWVANVCTYTFYDKGVIANIEFSKNFNMLAYRTKLNKEKRLTNISNELTIKSEDNFIDYCYFSSGTKTPDSTEVDEIFYSTNYFYQALSFSFANILLGNQNTYEKCYVDYISITTTDLSGNIFTYEINNQTYGTQAIYIPTLKYAGGNSLCFEMQFNEPMSAGYSTQVYQDGWWIFSGTNYFTNVVLYTGQDGFADIFSFKMHSNGENKVMSNLFPLTSSSINVPDNWNVIGNLKIWTYKMPNEIFGLNYQISFLPLPNRELIDFIYPKFLSESYLITKKIRNISNLSIYINSDYTLSYGVNTSKGIGTKLAITNITSNFLEDTQILNIQITHASYTGLNYGWSLCDEDGNVLFASNDGGFQSTQDYTTKNIYFITKNKRL